MYTTSEAVVLSNTTGTFQNAVGKRSGTLQNEQTNPYQNGQTRNQTVALKSNTPPRIIVVPMSPPTQRKDSVIIGNQSAFVGKYTIVKTVGKGNFAQVKLAIHHTTGSKVAIKMIDKTSLNKTCRIKLAREIKVLKILVHPNISELFDQLLKMGRIPETKARVIFRQLFSALEYCHDKHVVHRDLKAENLLLDAQDNIKIADFGFTNIFDSGCNLDTFCGSPPYAAPELLCGYKYHGPEVDVWALGVILYMLICGRLPFEGATLKELMNEEWVNIGFEQTPLQPYEEPSIEDSDSVREAIIYELGFSQRDLRDALSNGLFNNITATYRLLEDNDTRHRLIMKLRNQGQEISDTRSGYSAPLNPSARPPSRVRELKSPVPTQNISTGNLNGRSWVEINVKAKPNGNQERSNSRQSNTRTKTDPPARKKFSEPDIHRQSNEKRGNQSAINMRSNDHRQPLYSAMKYNSAVLRSNQSEREKPIDMFDPVNRKRFQNTNIMRPNFNNTTEISNKDDQMPHRTNGFVSHVDQNRSDKWYEVSPPEPNRTDGSERSFVFLNKPRLPGAVPATPARANTLKEVDSSGHIQNPSMGSNILNSSVEEPRKRERMPRRRRYTTQVVLDLQGPKASHNDPINKHGNGELMNSSIDPNRKMREFLSPQLPRKAMSRTRPSDVRENRLYSNPPNVPFVRSSSSGQTGDPLRNGDILSSDLERRVLGYHDSNSPLTSVHRTGESWLLPRGATPPPPPTIKSRHQSLSQSSTNRSLVSVKGDAQVLKARRLPIFNAFTPIRSESVNLMRKESNMRTTPEAIDLRRVTSSRTDYRSPSRNGDANAKFQLIDREHSATPVSHRDSFGSTDQAAQPRKQHWSIGIAIHGNNAQFLMQSLLQLFEMDGVDYVYMSPYRLRCTYVKPDDPAHLSAKDRMRNRTLKWETEVVHLSRLKAYGVRFKYISGDLSNYRKLEKMWVRQFQETSGDGNT